ncbi:uncharacterized protein si:dkeyp-75h12.7 isoform X2 [Conger conger]|uniref:uncharacterized protein si:dkeyp-75h12.7 isoform X2 n=1 Tax=Conger conger TaxID=82655 RepID=UPI002A5A1049|nr:uncharacterized protein si:dkeyp-75h12.7 isoform X2 [Conger conger]
MFLFPWCLAVVCVSLFTSGSEVLHCNMTVTWRDLRGLLKWDCPARLPNTTYTVQKLTQGDALWKAVGGCVRLTSRSCDVSRAFEKIDLYNFIRLELEDALGSVLSGEMMSDPLNEAVYGPPSLSLSLQGPNLTVSVALACSPIKACPPRDCCPLSQVAVGLCTSITVYSETHASQSQTHKKCGREGTVSYEFVGLAPGQRYCAVANFTWSPASPPRCVHVPTQTGSLMPLWLLGAVLFMIFSTVPVICHLRQRCVSAETLLPRALNLQDGESTELEVPCEDFPEDFWWDQVSIVSRPPSESRCVLAHPPPSPAQTSSSSQGDGYRSDPLPTDAGWAETAWDSGGTGGVLEPSDVPLLPQCIVFPGLSQDLWGPPAHTHTGPAGPAPGPPRPPPLLENPGVRGAVQHVPLCSVRLEACGEEEQEDTGWFDLEPAARGGL